MVLGFNMGAVLLSSAENKLDRYSRKTTDVTTLVEGEFFFKWLRIEVMSNRDVLLYLILT